MKLVYEFSFFYCHFPELLRLYSWSLNDMGLNYAHPLIHGFFPVVDTVLVHDPWLVESEYVEPQIQREM